MPSYDIYGFGVAVSQETGKPEERERQWNSQWVEHSEHTYLLFAVLYRWAFWHPKNNYNSNINDHWSHVTIINIIIMKIFEILE